MKKRRSSKAKNQTYHFKKRCDERLGVQIDRKSIQRRIKSQKYDENFYLLIDNLIELLVIVISFMINGILFHTTKIPIKL